MEHCANKQLSPVRSRDRGAHDDAAVISVHLSHHWLLRVNVLDLDDLFREGKKHRFERFSHPHRPYWQKRVHKPLIQVDPWGQTQ